MPEIVIPDWVRQWPQALLAVVATLLAMQVLSMVWRWWKGRPIWQRSDMAGLPGLAFMLVLFACFSFIDAQRHWTGWQTLAVYAVLIGGVAVGAQAWLALKRLTRRPNEPVAPPVQRATVPMALELKLGATLIGATAIYIGVLLGWIWLARHLDASVATRGLIALAWLLGVPAIIMLARWPGSIVQTHRLTIAASPEAVWDAVHVRETDAYYRASTLSYRRTDASGRRLVWTGRDLGTCFTCHKPFAPNRAGQVMHVEIREEVQGRSQRWRTTFPPDASLMMRVYRAEHESFEVHPHRDGAEISYTTIAERPRLFMLAVFWTGNVAADLLSDLKCHVEGTPGYGVFATARRQLAIQREAREHCACQPASAAGSNGHSPSAHRA